VAEALAATGMGREAILGPILGRLDQVRAQPKRHVDDQVMGALARECARRAVGAPATTHAALREHAPAYQTWGRDQIDSQALAQMEHALRLQVAVAGRWRRLVTTGAAPGWDWRGRGWHRSR
jgi:hypothetical protein